MTHRRLFVHGGRPLRSALRLVWRAYRLWDRNDCIDLSAAFAYHSLQSLFPILLIALGVVSRLLGNDDGLMEAILAWAGKLLPDSSEPVVRATFAMLYRQGAGAGFIGLVFLLLTASNAYLTLQRGTDRLWGLRSSDPQHVVWQTAIANFLRVRIEAFAIVFLLSVFIFFDQITTSFRMLDPGTWRAYVVGLLPSSASLFFPVSAVVDLSVSVVIACFLAFILLRLLPSKPVPTRPLVPGAVLIGVALTVLNVAVGRSLISLGSRFQAYGVIGGTLVLTLWVWVVGLILYYGVAISVVVNAPGAGGRSAPPVAVQTPDQGPG